MRNKKFFVVPVITGVTGAVSKIYIYGNNTRTSINRFSKNAVLGTSHIVMKVLQSET
jgi:hypothetical protein